MWITVAQLEELNDIQPRRVEVDGEFFVLFRSGDSVFCLRDVCSHAEVPLSGGTFDRRNAQVTCPQHGSRFDVKTGKALNMPAVTPVEAIPARVENGDVQLDIEE